MAGMTEGFQNSLEHLLAELRRIETKLRILLMKMRQQNSQATPDKFRGLYISEQDVDSILDTPTAQEPHGPTMRDTSGITALEKMLEQSAAAVALQKEVSLRNGTRLRLHELQKLFDLSDLDVDTLLVCILPEIDLKYQKVYGYLQDDITKKGPTVDMVLRLLEQSFDNHLAARQSFSPESALVRHHLVRFYDEHSQRPVPLFARLLQVDERIIGYLLEDDRIDGRLACIAQLRRPTARLEDIFLPDDMKQRLGHLVEHFRQDATVIYLEGARGVGKQTTAEALCSQLGVPMLVVDIGQMAASDTPELAVPLVFREGRLQDASLYFANDNLASDDRKADFDQGRLAAELGTYPRWVFLAGDPGSWSKLPLLDKPSIHIGFPSPDFVTRKQLWERQWTGESHLDRSADLVEIASKFHLNGDQIARAAAVASSLALSREPRNGLITAQDLYAACRQQSGQTLGALSQKIYARYGWEDIILPRDQLEQLQEICNYVKHYHTVYGEWGFGQKLSRGKGLNVLFAGPSGTGKTMSAEIIANELGLDLYRIDLSTVVSKYIGETEKNLQRIFNEGQASNAILFFDEADALFGKRSEVRDSHDRYANIEVAYLLQRMEEYEGIVILATNLRKNMDEAFARRMHFTIEFPIPEEADRLRIWKRIFPGEAPLARDIDLAFLAHQFKITGGNIKNIALGAAFLAAENGGTINMEKIIRAIKREYQKMGKLCTEGDFAQYFELVKS